MSLEKAKKYLEEKGYVDHVIELEESSATVQLAAEALGVEQGMIAKTMSFLVDGEPILILTEGTAKVDNHKYKDQFHVKAKMIPFDEVEEYIGHAPGGVCPFGIKDGIKVYLDESLKRFEMYILQLVMTTVQSDLRLQNWKTLPGHVDGLMYVKKCKERGLSVDDPLFSMHLQGTTSGRSCGCRIRCIFERSIDMMSEKNYTTGSDNVSE